MRDNEFEWDDAKAQINLVKHGISFDTARLAFADPNWFEQADPDPDENRFLRICFYRDIFIAIVYADRHDRNRIISARRATKHERRLYQNRYE